MGGELFQLLRFFAHHEPLHVCRLQSSSAAAICFVFTALPLLRALQRQARELVRCEGHGGENVP